MGNMIDFQEVQIRETIKKVAIRNGMDEYHVAKINKLDKSELTKETANSMRALGTITEEIGAMLDDIRNNKLRPQDSPAFAYAMFSFVREVFELQVERDPTEESKIALKEIMEYQDECKYLFVETDVFFKVLKMVL